MTPALGRQSRESMKLRPAWSTELVLRQQKIPRETVSQKPNKTNKKIKTIITDCCGEDQPTVGGDILGRWFWGAIRKAEQARGN